MKKALIVGINYYEKTSNLYGCVNDANLVSGALAHNYNRTKNFDIKLKLSSDNKTMIDRKTLKNDVTKLFSENSSVALFYFSGHGYIENNGGYLITSECKYGDDGFSMNDLLQIANESKAHSKIIIIDSCYSGVLGETQFSCNTSILSNEMTILTASSKNQYAVESGGTGVFTKLLVDALDGGAANLLGEITPGSIYAHIDQALGAWDQRPIFKTNVSKFTSIKNTKPPISIIDLRKINDLFPDRNQEFQLDPSFEIESDKPNMHNVEKFKVLQKYNRVNLVIPVDEEYMFFAAMNSKSCKLTPLGEHYWNLANSDRL